MKNPRFLDRSPAKPACDRNFPRFPSVEHSPDATHASTRVAFAETGVAARSGKTLANASSSSEEAGPGTSALFIPPGGAVAAAPNTCSRREEATAAPVVGNNARSGFHFERPHGRRALYSRQHLAWPDSLHQANFHRGDLARSVLTDACPRGCRVVSLEHSVPQRPR